MGLDMYAYEITHENPPDVIHDGDLQKYKPALFFEWYKHPNLHGFFDAIYREHYERLDEFNIKAIRLTDEMLDDLKVTVVGNKLPFTEGFFFGESKGSAEEREIDLEFIQIAKAKLKAGKHVYYYSWW